MNLDKWNLKKIASYGLGALLGTMGIKVIGRKLIDQAHDKAVRVIMEDIYDENLWELISAVSRVGPQIVVETNMRSTQGKVIERPLGPPKKFPSLDDLMFSIAQLYTMPTPLEAHIDTQVTIGKKARKPFTIDLPIMVAPMAYGVALSKGASIALAKGASLVGTAYCSGQGPYLPEARKAAKTYIYQYHRGFWDKTPQILMDCAAIELQFGQGALGGVGNKISYKKMDAELRKAFGVSKGEDAVNHSRQPLVQHPADLVKLVDELKDVSGGVPIGAKMGAGKFLEADLDWLCNSGIDYIALEGAEAATKGSPPILQDDFGVPTVFAITRAVNWLEKNGFKDKVSLIATGKIRTPGEVLKACALGADACYMGAIAMFAMTHTQTLNALPFEPPTQAVWYDGKFKNDFVPKKGAQSLAKFLQACQEELGEGIKALGKTSLREVNKNDLFALSELIAKSCGLPMVYEPFPYDPEQKTVIPSSGISTRRFKIKK